MGKVVKVKNLYIGQGKPKICAIVLGETVSEILAMVEQANQIDCDLIEFRADFYANILDPEKAGRAGEGSEFASLIRETDG